MSVVANRRSVMSCFSSPTDPECHRARIVLAEKDITVEIYDVDMDGRIGLEDLKDILSRLAGVNLSETQICEIARKTIDDVDTLAQGSISFQDFARLIESEDPNFMEHLTIVI